MPEGRECCKPDFRLDMGDSRRRPGARISDVLGLIKDNPVPVHIHQRPIDSLLLWGGAIRFVIINNKGTIRILLLLGLLLDLCELIGPFIGQRLMDC